MLLGLSPVPLLAALCNSTNAVCCIDTHGDLVVTLLVLWQVVLTVDVLRVGTYAMMPNASMTSRSLIPLQGDVSENEELMKMSGLMIYVSS